LSSQDRRGPCLCEVAEGDRSNPASKDPCHIEKSFLIAYTDQAMNLTIFVPITLIVALSCIPYAVMAFDRIVETLYNEDRAAWETEGKPYGYIQWPEKVSFFGSEHWATLRFSFTLIFVTPPWVLRSDRLRNLLLKYRMSALLFSACILYVAAFLKMRFL
jgi:hypothetical protein